MVTLTALVALLALGAACQGSGDASRNQPAPPGDDALAADAALASSDEASASAPEDGEPVPPVEPPDAGTLIEQLGAVPAWRAVVERGRYLARRGQRGVVYGTVGEPILVPEAAAAGAAAIEAGMIAFGYTWLVDDTEGHGSLGIAVQLGRHGVSVNAGDRVALAGAWHLDEERRWYWKVDEVTQLPAAKPSKLADPPAKPGHVIATIDRLPPDAKPISTAGDNELVYFTVVGRPPVLDGDGWPVASDRRDPVFALLNLPGERASFGGHDYRMPSERWQLERGHRYVVRIGRIRRPKNPDKPAIINARTAPVRVK